MKSLIAALMIVSFSLACAGSITNTGMRVVVGSAEVGEDCNAAGECETVIVGNGFTEGFINLAERTVELAVGVVTFFVPSGFKSVEDN